MEQNFYFKHDAPSSTNPKLAKLLQKEGARGYGVYWLLVELLRIQTDFRLPVSETAGMVARLGYTQKMVVIRVIENYGLFSCENGLFFSVGLIKRMENFLRKRNETSKERGGSPEANALIYNARFIHNARKEEQSREEQENNSLKRERVRGVLSMDEAVALLPSEQVWCEDMARMSGEGPGFAADLPQLLPPFAAFLRLRGEEHTVSGLSDAKRRFMYWMKSDEGRQALKQLHASDDAAKEEDVYRYEILTEGQRTYMGRPIPADAPPRPDSWAVWDGQAGKWTR